MMMMMMMNSFPSAHHFVLAITTIAAPTIECSCQICGSQGSIQKTCERISFQISMTLSWLYDLVFNVWFASSLSRSRLSPFATLSVNDISITITTIQCKRPVIMISNIPFLSALFWQETTGRPVLNEGLSWWNQVFYWIFQSTTSVLIYATMISR